MKDWFNKIIFSDLSRDIVKDKNTLLRILYETDTDFQSRTGFWLFASEFCKDEHAYLEFGPDSVWDPTYFVYTDIDDNVVAMRAFRIKDPIIPGYAHMIAMQVLDEYKGNHLSAGIIKDTIKYVKQHYPEIKGLTLECFEPSLENLYSRYGYKPFEKDGVRYMKMELPTNESVEPARCNIMYPGGFKPVHDGHISIINRQLNEENTYVYFIISKKDRDGISALSSKWFIDQIFGTYRNFVSIITDYSSPIHAVYNYTATKKFGDGLYVLATSNKDGDRLRARKFIEDFSERGKYYTPGIFTNDIYNGDDAILFTTRYDDYNESPVSSSVLRHDIMNGDYELFLSGYIRSIKQGLLDEKTVRKYYEMIRGELKYPKIQESGAAGHINHPYEDNDMTFKEIHEMITDLLQGKITDITEKLDGINIFASVDLDGNVIFARNKTQLTNTPMYINDIINNNTWNEKTKNSFIRGAETIASVFNNMPNKVRFFNRQTCIQNNNLDEYDEKFERIWCDIEIIDHDNVNVIPYVENLVSFHTLIAVSGDKNDVNIVQDDSLEWDIPKIEIAIQKTDKKEFKPQITPKILVRQTNEFNTKLTEYEDELEEILYLYKLNRDCTIADYKCSAYYYYLMTNGGKTIFTNYPVLSEEYWKIAERWSGKRKIDLTEFNKAIRTEIKSFEKESLKKLSKKVMMPIDRFFINLGNDVIKMCDGLSNHNINDSVISKIKNNIIDAIDYTSNSGNKKDEDRLEYLLARLGDETSLNSSEGIVFKYHGRTYKLTGSFAVLNQILALKKYKKRS